MLSQTRASNGMPDWLICSEKPHSHSLILRIFAVLAGIQQINQNHDKCQFFVFSVATP
jgi:hypothetical protein